MDDYCGRTIRFGLTHAPGDVTRHHVVDDAAGRQKDDLGSGRSTQDGRWPRAGRRHDDVGGRAARPCLPHDEQKPECHGKGGGNPYARICGATDAPRQDVNRRQPAQEAGPLGLGLNRPRESRRLGGEWRSPRLLGELPEPLFHVEVRIGHLMPPVAGSIRRRSVCRAA
jgi:hypothetical protein